MSKFQFSAITANGQMVAGVEDADTLRDVHRKLAERDLIPVNVHPKRSLLQFELTRKRVAARDLMQFSRQLSVFFHAGIPVIEALEVIASETTNKVFRFVLDDMVEALRAGSTVSAAATAHPEAFPPYYIGILRSAEVTGNLDIVLDQLADYIERDIDVRQKVISAIVYPLIVLGMAVVTVVVLMVFVLPRFQSFFDDFNAELPLPTRVLISFSRFTSRWGLLLLAVLVAVVGVLMVYFRTTGGRDTRDRLMLRLPIIGSLVRHAIVERFCRIFSSMLTAGVAVPEALAVTGNATNNRVYQRGIGMAREAMMRGEGLARPLAATGLFPTSTTQMFRVGENTGTFDEQLATAATYLDRELDYKIKRTTSYFEPAVILFIGVVVGFVAIALVSAMYGLYDQTSPP
ncbi:MAG: type II secretion system F family protein [Acidimicrobiales bacterium]